MHGSACGCRTNSLPTYTDRQVKRVVSTVHRVICCSDFIRRGIVARVGDDARIATVLNGVNTELFCPPPRSPARVPPVVLFIGRMLREKGPDLLVRAAIDLKKAGTPIRLRLVGSQNFNAADELTDFEQQLRSLARELEDLVEFLPFRSRGEVIREYQSADVACVPSRWNEPFGLVVLEAMACALPVVASWPRRNPRGGRRRCGVGAYADGKRDCVGPSGSHSRSSNTRRTITGRLHCYATGRSSTVC